MRIVFCTLISRIKRQFIHRNANCINSTFWVSRWTESGAVGAKKADQHRLKGIRSGNRKEMQEVKKLGGKPHHQSVLRAPPFSAHFFGSPVGQRCSYPGFRQGGEKDTRRSLLQLHRECVVVDWRCRMFLDLSLQCVVRQKIVNIREELIKSSGTWYWQDEETLTHRCTPRGILGRTV